SRARTHIQNGRPRFPVMKEQGMKIATAFFIASRNGNMAQLRSLLADDVVAYSDGGGRVPASPCPLRGLESVMQRHEQLSRDFGAALSLLVRYGSIDGLPAYVTVEGGGIIKSKALQIEQTRFVAISVTGNAINSSPLVLL